jgi:L-methionine (R)-S-oxide reductase
MTDYSLLREQLASMTRTERDTIANLANASALLYMSLSDINWAGFYLVREGQLVLGPFQGKPACIRIDFGKGVCGNAAAGDAAILVPDVHAFPGHIACDAASRSEIVVPVHHAGRLTAVLDIDSPLRGRFAREDQEGLERFCSVLEDACDWRI